MDNIVQAFMYTHPIRTKFLTATSLITGLCSIALFVRLELAERRAR